MSGLRVADASIMPTLVGANTHAVCVMIGEKAADLILDEWGRPVPAVAKNKEDEGSQSSEGEKKDEL